MSCYTRLYSKLVRFLSQCDVWIGDWCFLCLRPWQSSLNKTKSPYPCSTNWRFDLMLVMDEKFTDCWRYGQFRSREIWVYVSNCEAKYSAIVEKFTQNHECQPCCGAWGKVKGSPKSFGFILLESMQPWHKYRIWLPYNYADWEDQTKK